MARSDLLRWVPRAPQALCDILDDGRGAVPPPIRSEIFGIERFAQHGRSLGDAHHTHELRPRKTSFFPRLRSNIRMLREAHDFIGLQAATGYHINPAAEWLLDNFHLIEGQIEEIHAGMPLSYFRSLPMLSDEPLAGLPRVYGVAWAFVAHNDGAFDEDLLTQFLNAYQETRELSLGEMWALPTTLRVVLIENLRRLAERAAINKAARELANLCSDAIASCTVETLDQVLAWLDRRGARGVFLLQMAQRLQNLRITGEDGVPAPYQGWLRGALPDVAAMQAQQNADQTADDLSVSNAVISLRSIGDADWPEIIAHTSALMRIMLASPVFEAEDAATRDQTLHAIERLARRSGRSELAVAQTLLDLMQSARADDGSTVASYWLRGAGQPRLMRSLGLKYYALKLPSAARRIALPLYLGALLIGTLGLVVWMLRHESGVTATDAPAWLTALAVALMLFPASEAVVALLNRLISESLRPYHLPRLALAQGIPCEHRVLVVIPAMLSDSASIHELAHHLQLHHLANPERHAQFALLTDWTDADTAHAASDDALLATAIQQIHELNACHPNPEEDAGSSPRFILLHRERTYCETEQRWIGWERKRGKLEQLIAALAQGSASAFLDLGVASRLGTGTRYIVTLDSDTHLPPGRLRELVGVAAHPHNQPQFDAQRRSVVSGYGILQPRVATPLPAAKDFTPYHWLFAGHCGIDPYSAATSEVYQDLFHEGSFTGKGLLNVQAMHTVLSGRLPPGQVLSHDLLEGSIARCAAVTDITVIEDAPFHADVAAARLHRWTRGDWQLLPFLLHPGRYPMRVINRWKMFDNLRRSLVAPMSLALLVLALAGFVLSPWAALALVLVAYSGGPLLGAVAGISPSRGDVAKLHFYRQTALDLTRALGGGLWHLAHLLQQALLAADAVARALYRTGISRRHLLQWTTAAAAKAQAGATFAAVARQHWREPVLALFLFAALDGFWLAAATPYFELTLMLCLLWGASPVWTWWFSRARPARGDAALPLPDQVYLHGIARDTWRFFERCVGPEDRHLPPDNLQTAPHDMVAHRTSPTNIGLYLLSVACARAFGWIGTQDLIDRLEATVATLLTLQRHRGHFLNWYDTQTGAPLLPMYLSTVDSGNLCGHLLAVAQACREFSLEPHDPAATEHAIITSRRRLAPLLVRLPELMPRLLGDSALARLLAMSDPLTQCGNDPAAFERLLGDADAELAQFLPAQNDTAVAAQTGGADELPWCLLDHLATLRSAGLDVQARTRAWHEQEASRRLRALATACEQFAWEADFSFLYHPKRHLLHIGYRLAEQQLDAGFYDLLASESRLTSLLAIAKGDVPVRHWAALGRPFYAAGARWVLRSWSGSMFEYLMPSLVLNEPQGSVLRDACHAALKEQIAFAQAHHVPWGISESAYAGSDHTLAYQYAPQGVPRLALRRTPADELVIAPYATALAAQIAAYRACLNFSALEGLSARARYGFIEALDFSPARRTLGVRCTPVCTFMAHHQGMSIVALANVLLDGRARRWAMASAPIEAVGSMLHERAPREVTSLRAPPASAPLPALERRGAGLLRKVLPDSAALQPTHLLSNGRYSVSLRANGAGWSRWGQTGITRWRDDALRDAFGSFFYLRGLNDTPGPDLQRPVSLTHHPAPDARARYHSTYHADRMCFDTDWPELQAHTTVWVSPEDDIEFRRVELRNLSDHPLDLELMSAFDVALTDPRADEAHPAFTNLFVRAEWLAPQQALLFSRLPRLPTERELHAAHFLADNEAQLLSVRIQTDRARWLGRNHDASHPLAAFDALPTAPPAHAWDDGKTERTMSDFVVDTGLDPVCAISVQLHIAANAKAQLTFATAASDNSSTVRSLVDKSRQTSHVQRSSLMSATLTGIRLRALRVSAETFSAIQMLTTALALTLARTPIGSERGRDEAATVCDRRTLWRFGISGDRPLILVSAGVTQGLGLLRALAQALSLWSWGGVACDLVVVNAEATSYLMELQREIAALREQHLASNGADFVGFHVLRADELGADELSTLQTLARVSLQADGRPLLHHVRAWTALHEQAFDCRRERTGAALPVAWCPADVAASVGEFAGASGEFRFDVGAHVRPPRPWINVLSNPNFGTHISEAGGGFSWAVNSRLNQLTAWSNDPVADPPGEWFLLQNLATLELWNLAPNAWGDERATYRVSHGQGYSSISHRHGDVEVTVSWCVDAQTSVQQVRIQLMNHGDRTLQLRLTGMVEWMMGANRTDRGSTRTALYRQRLPALNHLGLGSDGVIEQQFTALMCTQCERSAGFGDGTAFFGLTGPADAEEDWTCDRRECFDARGRLVLPDHFGQSSGAGMDPCAALSTRLLLAPGVSVERVFLLGYGESPHAARQLAIEAAAVHAGQRLQKVRTDWDKLLGAITVQTPDPLFDAMVNRWLLYQTVSCRLWAKAGFYQAGGATGFRDQLQDAMALVWAEPELLRRQIVLCASRQFSEGDVQHWWHAPTGAGVRTHFSDDLLWLPYACTHYLRATGDAAVLDQRVPFIEGVTIPEGAEDAYDRPSISTEDASVYEHAARTIDRSLRVGVHGLPLMGSGDWNDGMNRVGSGGRGESVWLGWFLCQIVADFAPLAHGRGDGDRARRWEAAAQGWKAALMGPAWDGRWFRRAFFDDGQALGSHANGEARIDLIAQAWAVLCGMAPVTLQRMALAAVESHLVDHEAGLIKLIDPPLAHASPSAGYIQSYPAGVRENGGQYSHAGVWALMAQAELAMSHPDARAHRDLAYRYFTYLSPAHRAAHPVHSVTYGIEPYVMAGDVYSQPPYVGRGGWSWYTGAAAWLHRASIESIFGLKLEAQELSFRPCLPSHWQQAELTLTRDRRSLRFILTRATAATALAAAQGQAQLLRPGQPLRWHEQPTNTCFVIPLSDETEAAPTLAHA